MVSSNYHRKQSVRTVQVSFKKITDNSTGECLCCCERSTEPETRADKKAYEGLAETLEIYWNLAINRSKEHSRYADFEYAKQEDGIPVWFDVKGGNSTGTTRERRRTADCTFPKSRIT